MPIIFRRIITPLLFILVSFSVTGQVKKSTPPIEFEISMNDPSSKFVHVIMKVKAASGPSFTVKLPAWTTGYYQLLNYAQYVEDFEAKSSNGSKLAWEKSSNNGWTIANGSSREIDVTYNIKTTRPFVATNYLDTERAYLSPAGIFMYPENGINTPSRITVKPYNGWTTIATGLDPVKPGSHTFVSPDFDILYDSPFLLGNLDSLPSFRVNNIPHHFIAYKPGNFDRQLFMDDLKKIVETGSGIIGDLPYKHYSFLAIGPGGGGIEHLNSTSIAFNGNDLHNEGARKRMYSFLAHEYFHHYNVKRIRPIELGPFDYDKGSKTSMLWLSEGFTVYYEYVILRRAGLFTEDDVFKAFQSQIKNYEAKPGRHFQTPADASLSTWNDGPFGRTDDEVNKTISPYDKGPVLGWMLDLKIRHETKNKKSLDDLMRLLYKKYYQQQKRGFTEPEFRKEAETLAGTSLSEFFDYIHTLKEVNYSKYLSYAGLSVDTVNKPLPGAWIGLSVRDVKDSLMIAGVEWKSPAWESGLRRNGQILTVNGTKATKKQFDDALAQLKSGDSINLRILKNGEQAEVSVIVSNKWERSYKITPMENANDLQRTIWQHWQTK